MEILDDARSRIQSFLDNFLTTEIIERGLNYFLAGRVSTQRFEKGQCEINFTVVGSERYHVEIGLDPFDDELINSWDCDCPYFWEDTCKHVAASVIWIQNNWKLVSKQLGDEFEMISENGIADPPGNTSNENWEIKNFLTFNRSELSRLRPNHGVQFIELQNVELVLEPGPIVKAKLGFGSSYKRGISENHFLTIVPDLSNLKISCSCGQKTAYLCTHAYQFFEFLLLKHKMNIFEEIDSKSLDEQGKEALRKYGLNPDLDWKDYFNPGYLGDEKTMIPKQDVGNLITPSAWNLKSPDTIFKGNPEAELDINPGYDDKTPCEIGFFFRFNTYSKGFHFEPFVARESKKGVPMSIGFARYNDVNYHDHLLKRNSDIPLIALSKALEHSFEKRDTDKKLAYFSGYADAVASHPYVYYCSNPSEYQFRKGDMHQITFHSKPPRLKYILTGKAEFISIGVYFQLFGRDISINDASIEQLHPNFLKASDHLFYIPNRLDATHFESARIIDGKMIAETMLPELFEKYLNQALRRSDVEFKNLKKYKMSSQTLTAVSKEIYLSEVGNFVLFRPFIRYENDYMMDALSQESHWEVGEKGIVKTLQDTALAEEFRAELCEMYPEFKNQFNRTDYLHIGYHELLKDNLFTNLFAEFEKNEYRIFGVRDLKGLKINPYPGKVVYSVSSGIDWFEVDAKMVFGDQEIGIEQLKKRFKPGSDYIELGDGSRGLIPQEWLKKLERLFQNSELKGDKLLMSNKKFTVVDELFDELETEVMDLIHDKKSKLLSFDKMQKYPLPIGIKGTLRHYQEDGFQWLCFLDEFKWGGILADDMGLGKTLQIITFLKHILIKNKQTNLIVVPTSLLFNWENEIKKFAPSLKVHFYYGAQRIKSTDDFKKYDIVFTSYGHALSDIEILKDYPFNYVILDESQAIKNPTSKRFKAVKLLKANNRIAMTGTPIENNTFDLYAQMSFLNPGFLGSAKGFKADFAKAIDTNRDEIKAAELQRLIKPFVLRRTKTQVATELPDKIEEVLYCEMDKSQQKVYDAFRNEYRQRLIEKIDEEGMNKARFAVLEGLTKLRQICDTPEILPGDDKYSGKSVKTDLLMMHIKEKTANHKILIFSQFVKMLRVIENRIKKEGISYEYLDGQSTSDQRQASVEHFQNDDSCRVFLISLKAGGTGLNLMAADYVYLVDPWWNPAVENQAIDRCYRIGQDKKVIAYRMICKDTVEEKIMELQKKKKSIAGEIVTTDEGVLKKLKKEDLIGLFG